MRQIAVISGKGGTGKTSLIGSFAALSRGTAVLADCDVDAANLGLILNPSRRETHDFSARQEPVLDRSRCDRCGACAEACRFDAIGDDLGIDPLACEGCGVCRWVCPRDAIDMRDTLSGHWYVSDTPYGTLVHARLMPGEGNSGKLVTAVRNRAAELCRAEGRELLLIDGSPGIGCPVIASLAGVSSALVVTEPSLSGIHDLERILGVCTHFGVRAQVCINRYDIHLAGSEAIADRCRHHEVDLVGKVPYDPAVTEAVIGGLPVVAYSSGKASRSICALWERLNGTRGVDQG